MVFHIFAIYYILIAVYNLEIMVEQLSLKVSVV